MTLAHRHPQPDASHEARSSTTRPGFTLTEAAVLVAGLALGATLLAPTLGAMRTESRLAGSRDNLRQLGEAHSLYSESNGEFIGGFDWTGDRRSSDSFGYEWPVYDIGGGFSREARSNYQAIRIQATAIIRKMTGRFGDPETRILYQSRLHPGRRYSHLMLLDYLGSGIYAPEAVNPLDAHLQDFQERPTSYSQLPGSDPASRVAPDLWADENVLRMWPYASSYQTTVYAFSPSRPMDGHAALFPTDDGTLFNTDDIGDAFVQQHHTSVRFPSIKALMFEEFDYSAGLGNQGRYYADPLASVNILAFDGAARRIATADANPGWDPANFRDMEATPELRYHSIDTRYFPDDSERPDPYPGYYKWTRGGLEGIDFGASEVNTSEW